jgi:hypothetical protein
MWGGVVHPPEKWSSRSQTKCSWSQNYVFVYTWCFAKQTKYLIFSKLGDVSDSNFWVENLLKRNQAAQVIIWRNIISQNPCQGIKFPFTYTICHDLHFYLEFRFRKVIHGWYSMLAKISTPQNHIQKQALIKCASVRAPLAGTFWIFAGTF